MNTPLRRVAMAVIGMIVLLLANATYIQVVSADTYRTDPRNRRVLLDEYSRQRGQIIAGGLPLANSVETGGQLRFLRTYLNGPLYAPVTGYYSLRYGSGGVENAMDAVLNGSDGRLFVRRISDLITGREPSGGSVELTINPAVQKAAYEGLTRKGYTGAVVAIKPSTGEILAMASTPSYDPNRLSSHDGAVQEAAWNADTSPQNHSPLTDRAVAATYPPGSTFKLVVTAAALESGRATPNTPLPAASALQLQGTTTLLHNFADQPCGGGTTATLTQALVRSCNTAFAQLATIVGENELRKQAQALGIGQQDLTIPIPVAPSTVGAIPDIAALEQSGIGQRDVALSPLQNAMVAATIANGGVRMKPQLVRNILGPDLSVLERFAPEQAGVAMSRFTASEIRDMMVAAENSYRNDGKINGITIAAKTGTAEHGADPKNTPPHGWYVAFAPANNPQVAVAVVVEDGGDRNLEATGGSLAAPIGRAVIGAALQGAR
ncbi:MAG: penicillin-binding protein 2 [Pseudonocardiales bacterium]|nr:penicillin-binding protein 2 [Pseudonocardiales bacterium]MBV9652174.1 penicillin-binding protein 2 [Pseudonocardiales bacterium]